MQSQEIIIPSLSGILFALWNSLPAISSPFLEFQNQKTRFIYMPRIFVKLGAYDFVVIMKSSHSIWSMGDLE